MTSTGWVALSRERGGRNMEQTVCPNCGLPELRPRAKCANCHQQMPTLGSIKAREGGMMVRFNHDGSVFSINGERVGIDVTDELASRNRVAVKANR